MHQTGEYDFGTVSVNGSRSQNCPGDPDFDTDGLALQEAQAASGANNLEPQSKCSETVNGDKEKNTFSKSYKYEKGGGGANPINVANGKAGKKVFK